jgi:hypothetical protein
MLEPITSEAALLRNSDKLIRVLMILQQFLRLIQTILMQHMLEGHVRIREAILQKLLKIITWLLKKIKKDLLHLVEVEE